MNNHFDIAMEHDDLKKDYGVVANYIAFSTMPCPAKVTAALKARPQGPTTTTRHSLVPLRRCTGRTVARCMICTVTALQCLRCP